MLQARADGELAIHVRAGSATTLGEIDVEAIAARVGRSRSPAGGDVKNICALRDWLTDRSIVSVCRLTARQTELTEFAYRFTASKLLRRTV